MGDRADFQVMVELGPQTNTQPLANQPDNNSNSKRNSANSLSDDLYAQRQHDKQVSNGNWLENWSKSVKNDQLNNVVLKPKPGLAVGEIDAKSVIPDDEVVKANDLLLKKLRAAVLRKRIANSTDTSVTTTEKGSLDDVSLD